MVTSGYPTPDKPVEQTYRCVSVFIPDAINDIFMSVLMGQLNELTKDWYWYEEGTMTPDEAAFVWAIAVAMTNANGEPCTMFTCQDVADCIASNLAVQTAIQNYLSATGQNGGAGNPTQALPASVMDNNIIPLSALCTDANKYAMARAIVQGVDKLAVDFLEVIQLITDRAEIASEIVQAVPIFGGLASLALDFATFINTYIKDTYLAAYNSTTEVDYSCVIYCAFTDCELTWDGVISAYETQANITPPQNTDFATVMTWLFNNVIANTDNLIVGIMHVFILNCLRYGSNWFGSGVWTALEIAVQDASDEEITVPAACVCVQPNTAYYADFETSQSSGLWWVQTGVITSGGVESVYGNTERIAIRLRSTSAWTMNRFEVEYTRSSSGNAQDYTALSGYDQWEPPTVIGRVDVYDANEPPHAEQRLKKCVTTLIGNATKKDWVLFMFDDTLGAKITIHNLKVWSTEGDVPADITANDVEGCT